MNFLSLKKILLILGFLAVLVLLILFWNLGRQQKPNPEISQSLTKSAISDEINFDFPVDSILTDISKQTISNNSKNQEVPSDIRNQNPSQEKITNILSKSQPLFITDNRQEIYKISSSQLQNIQSTILSDLVQDPLIQKNYNYYSFNLDTKNLDLIAYGVDDILFFELDNQDYLLLLVKNIRGYSQLFLTTSSWSDSNRIDINNNEHIVKMKLDLDNDNYLFVEANNQQKDNFLNNKYVINLKELIENQSSFYQKVEDFEENLSQSQKSQKSQIQVGVDFSN